MLAVICCALSACVTAADQLGRAATPQKTATIGRSQAQVTDTDFEALQTLAGTWKLVLLAGNPVPDKQLRFVVGERTFTAHVNCNTVSGHYSLKGGVFVPEQAAATQKGCVPTYQLDARITRAMQGNLSIAFTDRDRLIATGDDRLEFVRVP
jgi:heat shock protein HslJ